MVAVPAVLDGRQATRLAEDAGEVAGIEIVQFDSETSVAHSCHRAEA